jgi:hypothetical protein
MTEELISREIQLWTYVVKAYHTICDRYKLLLEKAGKALDAFFNKAEDNYKDLSAIKEQAATLGSFITHVGDYYYYLSGQGTEIVKYYAFQSIQPMIKTVYNEYKKNIVTTKHSTKLDEFVKLVNFIAMENQHKKRSAKLLQHAIILENKVRHNLTYSI